MDSLLSLRALNTLRLLQLAAAGRRDDALETQHSHGCIDAMCFDLVTDHPDSLLEQIRAELLFRPGFFGPMFGGSHD
jgi:hypothetical protein